MRREVLVTGDLLFDGAMLHGGMGWREYIKRTENIPGLFGMTP